MTDKEQEEIGLSKPMQRLQTVEIRPSEDNLIHQKFTLTANNGFSKEVPMEKGLKVFRIDENSALDNDDDAQICNDLFKAI